MRSGIVDMSEADKGTSKLSGLGLELERALSKILRDLEKEEDYIDETGAKKKRPKYTLMDKMRVYDRALKLESIKAKLDNDDGSFFEGSE